jgi:hypothetical protein
MTSSPEPPDRQPPDHGQPDDSAVRVPKRPQRPQRPEHPENVRMSRIERRRQKIRDEIERNRRGEYRVPTWVLALALLLLIGGWLALVLLS